MGKKRTIPEDQKKYKCPVKGCDKKCSNPSALKNHIRFKHPDDYVTLYPTSAEGGKDTSFRKEEGGSGNGGGDSEDKDDGWVPW